MVGGSGLYLYIKRPCLLSISYYMGQFLSPSKGKVLKQTPESPFIMSTPSPPPLPCPHPESPVTLLDPPSLSSPLSPPAHLFFPQFLPLPPPSKKIATPDATGVMDIEKKIGTKCY